MSSCEMYIYNSCFVALNMSLVARTDTCQYSCGDSLTWHTTTYVVVGSISATCSMVYLGLQVVGVLVVEPYLGVVAVAHGVACHPVSLVRPPLGHDASDQGWGTQVHLKPLVVCNNTKKVNTGFQFLHSAAAINSLFDISELNSDSLKILVWQKLSRDRWSQPFFFLY